jgi:hypothetical protein
MTPKPSLLLAAALAISSASSIAQPVGLWDFNSGNLNGTVGGPLTTKDAATVSGIAYGTTTSFSLPNIGGSPASVAHMAQWNTPSGLVMPVAANASGGGSTVNQWSIVFDILSPIGSDGKWRTFIETDGRVIQADADFFINPANGIGISGNYTGTINPNQWHRVTFVVDNTLTQIRKYIDGVLVGTQASDAIDGRWSLTANGTAELFTDNDGDIAPLYVNSIALWDRALSNGEVQALGAPTAAGIPQTIPVVPAFLESTTPQADATSVNYLPAINVVLNPGNSTVPQSSVKMLLNGQEVAATVAPVGNNYTLDFQVVNPLVPNSKATVGIVYSENGTTKTNSFSFTVENYINVTLPAPFLVENFDLVPEAEIPSGWVRTNRTDIDPEHNFIDLDDLDSNSYLDWTVVSKERLQGLKGGIFNQGTIILNGAAVESLGNGNMLYAESDVRGGNQVQMVFSKDFDFTGKKNVFIAFESMYEQNQDNINSFEYSIDGGLTWLPGIYFVDLIDGGGDVIFNADGSINVAGVNAQGAPIGTLNRVPGGSAYNLPYGAFIGAPVTEALAPYISPRLNDNDRESKRIEVIRLFQADNQPKVRLRFMQAGTGSWYWGVDNIGFYEIPEPRIVFGPVNKTVDFGANVTLSVTASGDPTLTYQWYQNGNPVANGTGATLTLTGVTGASAGDYTVKVSNSLGSATSAPGKLNVLLRPVITTAPVGVLASAGAPISLSVAVGGQAPFTYQWSKNGTAISGATANEFSIATSAATDSGDYTVTISNTAGSTTSTPVKVTVLPLIPITQDLVVHLPFDSNSNDTSGRNNNGTPEVQPEIENGTLPAHDAANKAIGAGSINLKLGQHVLLGNPEDLNFGTDTDFTFSFWVWGASPAAWTGDPSFIGNKNWNAGGNPGYVVATGSGGSWKWNWAAPPGPRRDTLSFPNVADGQWHNIVVSHDRDGLAYFYVDGVLRATITIANDGDINALAHYIGQDGTGRYGFDNDLGARFVDIRLDDFGIWRRLLTPQEAASIFAHGKQGEDLKTASGQVVVLAPNITASPASRVVSAGSDVSLSATVAGTAPFTYEWKRGDTIVGTSATLNLTAVDASTSGDYTLTVRNSAGNATSTPAKIRVISSALSDDLVAHIKFDGNYQDSSGRNNHTTARGNPTLVAGKFGQAMQTAIQATGSDFASFGKPADLNFAEGDFSVSFWINSTTWTSDPPFISNKDWDSSSNIGWGVFAQGGGNFRVNATGTPRGSGNRMDTSATPNIRDGNWHNVVVSFWRGAVTATYVDGALVNSTPLLITGSVDAGFDTNIGQDGPGDYGGVTITAKVDDVALWRRALSAQEAARIFGAAGDLSTLTPAQLKVSTFMLMNGNLHITVTGASGTARLERRASFDAGTQWQDVGPVTASMDIPVSTGNAFYRIVNP